MSREGPDLVDSGRKGWSPVGWAGGRPLVLKNGSKSKLILVLIPMAFLCIMSAGQSYCFLPRGTAAEIHE